MDIFSLALRFLCAAAAGFLVMSLFGVQALVDLCSSIPLAKRRKKQASSFSIHQNHIVQIVPCPSQPFR